MSHGNTATFPRLADNLCFVSTPAEAVAVAVAVVTTQRDAGDRKNRKHARLKYTVEDRGIAWFRAEVAVRAGFTLQEPRPYTFTSNGDALGWTHVNTDGDDVLTSYTFFIQNGRIRDVGTYRIKSGLAAIAAWMPDAAGPSASIRFTPNQNVVAAGLPQHVLVAFKGLLTEFGIINGAHSGLRLNSMACVSMPTCGLALAEAERYLPVLLTRLEIAVEEAGLRDDAITIRMTGASCVAWRRGYIM